jgi:Tfp pilus assembly protein PilV
MIDRREDGFGLLEVIVCVALLVTGSVVALALVPPIVRASQAGLTRIAATDIARNAIERMRAASAYVPPALTADAAVRANALAQHGWVLAPAATYVAAARIRRALCGNVAVATSDVPMTVTTAYDAASDTVTVAVAYPPNPCLPATIATVTLSARLTPAAFVPQSAITSALADPAVQ